MEKLSYLIQLELPHKIVNLLQDILFNKVIELRIF